MSGVIGALVGSFVKRPLIATGGTIQDIDGRRYHAFTTSSNFTVTQGAIPAGSLRIESVGGGQGGTGSVFVYADEYYIEAKGGAGGAGAELGVGTNSSQVGQGSYPVVIPAGGQRYTGFGSPAAIENLPYFLSSYTNGAPQPRPWWGAADFYYATLYDGEAAQRGTQPPPGLHPLSSPGPAGGIGFLSLENAYGGFLNAEGLQGAQSWTSSGTGGAGAQLTATNGANGSANTGSGGGGSGILIKWSPYTQFVRDAGNGGSGFLAVSYPISLTV